MNPRDLRLVQSQIDGLKAVLMGEDDEQLWVDSIQGETSVFELVAALLDGIEADEGIVHALTDQMNVRKSRRDAAELRITRRRNAIGKILEYASLDKLLIPEATVSVRKVLPKLIVVDADAVPDELCTFTRKPSLTLIRDADTTVPGTVLDNGHLAVTIRRR